VKEATYNADSLDLLEYPANCRKRPGMFIGGTSIEGLHHLLWEIFDNAIDEALNGACNKIVVTNEGDGWISVQDNGRGIPIDKNKKTGKSGLELVFCELHAGGKFHNDEEGAAHSTSCGLHGVGSAVVNALSEFTQVNVWRNKKIYQQTYSRGVKECDVHEVEKPCHESAYTPETGTYVRFKPDNQIFKHVKLELEYARVLRRAREVAFLVPGLTVEIRGWKGEGESDVSFKYDNGLTDMIIHSLGTAERLTTDCAVKISLKDLGCEAEVAFAFETGYDEHLVTYVNTIPTHEGGVHREAFLSALLNVIITIGEQEKLLAGFEGKIKKSDVLEGLHGAVAVCLRQPEFEGQTKGKLGNPEIRQPLEEELTKSLTAMFKKRHDDVVKIATKIIEAVKARDAARKAKDLVRKKGGELSLCKGKLADCESRKPEECEIFIVEGESACGTAKMGRNRKFQAILPFRGKVINAEKHLVNKIMDNKEIQSLISALGVTPTQKGHVPDADDLKYHKIFLMNDADNDGAHICCLILTFFYKYMKTLIERGHVYVTRPPLFRIRKKNESLYLKNEEELERYRQTHDMSGAEIMRFKGLGEMNPNQLAETVLDPKTRDVCQVTIEDAVEAARAIEYLMGNDMEGRKNFLFNELNLADEMI